MVNVSTMNPKVTQGFANAVPRRPIWTHVFMALFGVGWAVSFDVGVRLYGAEIVTVLGLLLIRWQALPARIPMLRKTLATLALWLLAIILSDIANGTVPLVSARHMATPILGAASLIFAVAVLTRNPAALLTFLAATAIAKALFGDAAYGDTFADQSLGWTAISENTNIFKVRIVPFLTPAILLCACLLSRRSRLFVVVFILLASVGYFAVDSRSTGLILFLSGLMLLMLYNNFRARIDHLLIGCVLVTAVFYASYAWYVNYTIAYNPHGHNGQQLLRLENPYNPFSLLLQGRSEWLVWPVAFAERPFFGWGSWAEDKDGRFSLLRLALLEAGTNLSADSDYIPVHSLIGAAIVWSGLLGLVAMLWFLRIVLSLGSRLPYVQSHLLPAVVFLLLQILWDYLYSPPQHVRLTFPVALASLIVLTNPLFNQNRRGPIGGRSRTVKELKL